MASRLKRTIAILEEIENGRATSVDYLVRMLNTSRRTIFRDLDALSEAGIPCLYDRSVGRYVTNRTDGGIVQFDESECLSLLILFCSRDLPQFAKSNVSLRRAISKVVEAMPSHHREASFKLLRQYHPDHAQHNIFRDLELQLEC